MGSRAEKQYRWPDDGRDWMKTAEAEKILNISQSYVPTWAREHGMEIWKPGGQGSKILLLRAEVESMGDFRRLHWKWKKQHNPDERKRQTERMTEQDAAKIFCDVTEAAAMLGVTRQAVCRLARRGRLYSYQSKPGVRGSRLWFSRRAVEQIRDETQWQQQRERALRSAKSPAATAEAGKGRRERGAWLDTQGAFENRSLRTEPGQGSNWLNANEVAALMGVRIRRINQLRRAGFLEGVKIGKRPGHGPWHYREGDIREWMTRPEYLMFRERWENQGESERVRREAEERERARERRRVEAVERRRELGLGGHPSGSVWGNSVW